MNDLIKEDPYFGECGEIIDRAIEVLGSNVPKLHLELIGESLHNFCKRDCSSCPIDMARRNIKVTMDRSGSTALSAIDALDALAYRFSNL